MREIKFRAWDKTRNIYGEVLGIHRPYGENDSQFPEGHKGRLSLFNIKNEHDCGFWGIWIEKAELEQFTGLRDKNGEEIYEGDILDYGLIKGFVEFVGLGFSLTRGDHGYVLKPKDYSECEVIGNIHENPELLEGVNAR